MSMVLAHSFTGYSQFQTAVVEGKKWFLRVLVLEMVFKRLKLSFTADEIDESCGTDHRNAIHKTASIL